MACCDAAAAGGDSTIHLGAPFCDSLGAVEKENAGAVVSAQHRATARGHLVKMRDNATNRCGRYRCGLP